MQAPDSNELIKIHIWYPVVYEKISLWIDFFGDQVGDRTVRFRLEDRGAVPLSRQGIDPAVYFFDHYDYQRSKDYYKNLELLRPKYFSIMSRSEAERLYQFMGNPALKVL